MNWDNPGQNRTYSYPNYTKILFELAVVIRVLYVNVILNIYGTKYCHLYFTD